MSENEKPDILQKHCPECGHPAVKIARERPNTRTCQNGHNWFPIKNPAPRKAIVE